MSPVRRLRLLGLALVAQAVVLFAGCSAPFHGVTLEPPTQERGPVSRNVWIAPVTISDPQIASRVRLQDELTLEFSNYVHRGGYFQRATRLPGVVGAEDLVLHLDFNRFRQVRRPLPESFLAQIFTVGLFGIFGGDTHEDRSYFRMLGQLKNAEGDTVAKAKQVYTRSERVSAVDRTHPRPNGVGPRSEAIDRLLEELTSQLQKGSDAPQT